jgi:hypothetical protein
MRADKIVQFVFFETTLASEQFIVQWEQYIKPVNSNLDATLQQSEKNGAFKYIAQHRFTADEFQFVFAKAGRSSRVPEVEIKAKQVGGYSILQIEKENNALADECKAFVFITDPRTDLAVFKQLHAHSKLNIYEAYYENCQYAYILEFFVKTKHVAELQGQLKQYDTAEIRIYKECTLHAV